MRALLTGSQGFVGKALGTLLHARSTLIGTVKPGNSGASLPWNTLECDWTQPDSVKALHASLAAPIDLVIHAAFSPPPGSTRNESETAFEANEAMAEAVARQAQALGAKRLLLLSTGSVYSEQSEPVTESSPTQNTKSGYAGSSLRIERAIRDQFKGDLIIARLFYPYGPGQSSERLVPRLARQIRNAEPISVRAEGGGPIVNPLLVSEAAEALARLALHSGIESQVINIGGPEAITVRALAERIARHLGKTCRFTERNDPNASGSMGVFCSLDRLQRVTTFRPRIGVDQGLQLALTGLTL